MSPSTLDLAPGVHLQHQDAERQAPMVLRTDIAALVGLAERGPLDLPLPLESWAQFRAHFGEALPGTYLADAVRAFFENGGRRVWVVRVAARNFEPDMQGGASAAQCVLLDSLGRPAWRITAATPGSWGNELQLSILRVNARRQEVLQFDPEGAQVHTTRGFAVGDLVELQQSGVPTATRVLVEIDVRRARLAWVATDPRLRRAEQTPWLQGQGGRPLVMQRVAYRLELRRNGRWLAGWDEVHLPDRHPRSLANLLAPTAPDALAQLRMPPPASISPPLPQPAWLVAERLGDASASTPPGAPASLHPDTLAAPLALDGGADGLAALTVDDFIGLPVSPLASDLARARATRGLAALADIEQVALVAMPDLLANPVPDPDYAPTPLHTPGCQPCPPAPEAVQWQQPRQRYEQVPGFADNEVARAQATLLADCELRLRFAVLSAPRGVALAERQGHRAWLHWRERLVSDEPQRAGALYGPWLALAVPGAITAPRRLVPPCGHVLGALARCDLAHGVARAPAQLELIGAVDTRQALSAAAHAELNAGSVNVIRCGPGAAMGSAPWLQGARSLSDEVQWRYVHVVRLVQALRRGCEMALRWVVFEPNSAATRLAVASVLESLLMLFYERGAFAGSTPATSFYVRCDEETTDGRARERGELLAWVGVAPVAPAEFIVMRVGRQNNLPQIALGTDIAEAFA
jgi:uncharacterized protein